MVSPYIRRKTKTVYIGKVPIGGEHPISIQSMNNTRTADVPATVAQLCRLAEAGADIGRLAVADSDDAAALTEIIAVSPLPLVADIHFDYRLALAAIRAGIAGMRINPGNIGDAAKVRAVANAAKEAGIPIRIGVNGGSLEKDILQKYQGVSGEGLAESALRHVEMLEDVGFFDIKISLKSSNLPIMLDAYRKIAVLCDYPLHIGVTEAGTAELGTLKSALGLSPLLTEGIGDTMRVSLTGDPVREITVARQILSLLGIRRGGFEFVSCPTCGRTKIDVEGMALAVQAALANVVPPRPIKIAIMGCVVNGPGEAADADIGIAGGSGGGLLFARGKSLGRFDEDELLPALLSGIDKLLAEE